MTSDVRKFKIMVALTALLLGGTAVSAQSEWSAGIGYAATGFSGADASAFLTGHRLHGFYAGISREFYFSSLAGLTFEPGVYFYYQSGQNDAGLTPKFIKMHYLSLPLNLKYSFEIAPSMLVALSTGPVLNLGLVGNLYEDNIFVTNPGTDPMRHLTRVNIQWNAGVGIVIANAVQLKVAYALGVSRLVPEQTIHNNTFTVGASFLF